ncbi:MAG TPA: DUF4214 domain-containing protein [Azospirillaceae bacterium]|nr:DUF4214 domain-containing protein [Azospirillaceae bacterium]
MSIQSDIQKLYLALFNRPADPAGLAYWEQQAAKNGGRLDAVLNAFAASPEYKALYDGKSAVETVKQFHLNLFGRPAEPEGVAHWAELLGRDSAGAGSIAFAMLSGATGDDAKVAANKLKVAEAFTAALDTDAEIQSYAGTAAALDVRSVLSTVDGTAASVEAAIGAIPARVEKLVGIQDWKAQTITLKGDADIVLIDPEASLLHLKVQEDSTVTDLSSASLDMLYISGPGALTVTNVGATVRAVSAFEAEGAVRIDLTTTDTARMLGGRGNDVFTGGGAADFIAGGRGSDTLNGEAGADTYTFEKSGDENGTDIIMLEAGAGGDILDFGAFFLNAAAGVERNGATGTAINAFTAADKGDVNIANKVALYSGTAEVTIDPAGEIAGLINGAGDAFSLAAGGKAVLVTGDAGGADRPASIWFVHDTDGNGIVATDEVKLVGLTSGGLDIDTLVTTNFTFDFVTIVI